MHFIFNNGDLLCDMTYGNPPCLQFCIYIYSIYIYRVLNVSIYIYRA